MAVLLFLVGTVLFVLAIVAFFKPLPKILLGTKRAAAVALTLSVGSCIAAGLISPAPQAPSSQDDDQLASSTEATPAADPLRRRSTAPGIEAGSQAARVMDEYANSPASADQRATLRRLREPARLAQLWRGLPEVRMPDCGRLADRDLMCVTSQISFIEESWPGAWKGDYQAQRNAAFCLSTGCDGAVMVSPIQACAWRFVIAVSGSPLVDGGDARNLEMECGRLSATERAMSQAQAERITLDIG